MRKIAGVMDSDTFHVPRVGHTRCTCDAYRGGGNAVDPLEAHADNVLDIDGALGGAGHELSSLRFSL